MDAYKVATEGFKRFADDRSGKLKGLKEAAALAVTAAGFATGSENEDLSLWLLVATWCGVYVAYRLGSLLDKCIFEKLYGANCVRTTEQQLKDEHLSRSRPSLQVRLQRTYHAFLDLLPGARMLMYVSRMAAARQLGAGDRIEGLYATAEKLLSHTDAWADEVKPVIAWSKAARTVAVLLVALAAYGLLFQSHDFPAYTSDLRHFAVMVSLWWPLPLLLAVVALLTYLTLRVRHINVLYALVAKSNVKRFTCVDKTPGAEPGSVIELIAVASVVSPVQELPLLNSAAQAPASASPSPGSAAV